MSQENVEIVRTEPSNSWSIRGAFVPYAIEEMDDDFEMGWSNSIGPLSGVLPGRRVPEFLESFLGELGGVEY